MNNPRNGIREKDVVVGDYIIKKTLGQGTFGKVKLGIHKPTNEKVAIKILEKSKIIEKDDEIRVTRELEMMQKFNLKSPNTILWILKEQGGTNRYTNQDIVQTTNSNNTSNENCSGKEIA